MIAPQNNTTPVMRSSLISNDLITLAVTPSSSSSSSSVVTIKNYLRDGILVMKYGNITCLLLNCIIILYFVVDSTVCMKHVDSAV